jgi:tRNA pseudouridine38-40 synthase
LLFKLNCVLPDAIVISELRNVQQDFHARFTATSREYKYYITKQKNPFNKNTWWIKYELDTNKMQQAGKSLLGKKDFSSFAKLNTDVANHICEVTHFDIKEEGSNVIITISANRFLRNMVRAIVGTLASVGLGKISVKEFIDVIDKKDRSAAGLSAPAQGLFLCAVKYPEAEITVINKVEEEESGNE